MPHSGPSSLKLLSASASFAACLSLTRLASSAAPLEQFGAPTASNGLTSKLLGRSAETAYFNAALLPNARESTDIGFFAIHTRADIRLKARPGGVDVPESIYDAEIRNPDGSTSRLLLRPLPTSQLPSPRTDTAVRETITYAIIGVVRPVIDETLVFGFYSLLPVRSFQEQDAFFSDEREQYFENQLHFELLGDRQLLTAFAVALGSRITDWLSIGVGLDVTIGTKAVTSVYVPDAGDQRSVLLNPDIVVETQFAPNFALVTEPSDWLRLAATLHLPAAADTDGENQLRFWNYNYPDDSGYIAQRYQFSQGYQPLRATAGIALLDPRRGSSDTGSELALQATLERWSGYRDRHGEAPLERFHNTISPAVGGAVESEAGRFSADFAYFPSPVPAQTGRENRVDNHRVALSAGYERPMQWGKAKFQLGAFIHGQWMIPRSVEKSPNARHPVLDEFPDSSVNLVNGAPITEAAGLQTNNPGYPGFESSGFMLGIGLSLRLPSSD